MGLMPSDSQVVMVNGEPVRCFCAGSGPPLVLLHGLGGAAVVWYRNLPVLAEHYTVYAPDLWGPGRHSGSHQNEECVSVRLHGRPGPYLGPRGW